MNSSSSTSSAPVEDVQVVTAAERGIGAQEFYESLTGFDEIAVSKAFGAVISAFAEQDPIRFGRALMFVDLRRQGFKDVDAYQRAMNSTNGESTDYFADDPAEINDLDPDSEPGKGA